MRTLLLLIAFAIVLAGCTTEDESTPTGDEGIGSSGAEGTGSGGEVNTSTGIDDVDTDYPTAG